MAQGAVAPPPAATLRLALALLMLAGAARAGPPLNSHDYMEDSLLKSLANCPLCAGKEPCLIKCKQEEGRPWSECLNFCLSDNPMVRDVMQGMAKDLDKRSLAKKAQQDSRPQMRTPLLGSQIPSATSKLPRVSGFGKTETVLMDDPKQPGLARRRQRSPAETDMAVVSQTGLADSSSVSRLRLRDDA